MQTHRKHRNYFAYRSFQKEPEAVRAFTEQGFNLFTIFPANTMNSLGTPYSPYPPLWLWRETYDFAPLDRQINDILAINPNAEFLCMIDLNSPLWLARQLTWSGNRSDSYAGITDALAYGRWRELTEKYVAAFVDYAERHWGGRIRAYIPAAGVTDEWMDYSGGCESVGKFKCYREWSVREGLPEPARIPSVSERFDVPHAGTLRDPEKNSDALRYWRFHSEFIAESIADFAKLIRRHLLSPKDIGVFYGYILELCYCRLVQCGHLAYEKLLASGEIDFLISPGSYSDRPMGGFGGFMMPNGTVHRYGKRYMHECDQRTHTANMQITPHVALNGAGRWFNTREDIAGVRREFARSLIHGTSLWMFDMWGQFYVEPEILRTIGRCREIWEEFDDENNQPDAEVAFIVDPDSAFYVNDAAPEPKPGHFTIYNLHHILRFANVLGAPYRVYSFNDLPEIRDLDRFKLVIFPGLFEVTPEKESLVRSLLMNSNRHILWLYGMALSDGKKWDEKHMEAFSGIPFGSPETSKNMGTWISHFLPQYSDFTAVKLKKLAKEAGVHLYAEEEIPVFATETLLMVHSGKAAEIRIELPRKKALISELFEGKLVFRDADAFTLQCDGPQTWLFELR